MHIKCHQNRKTIVYSYHRDNRKTSIFFRNNLTYNYLLMLDSSHIFILFHINPTTLFFTFRKNVQFNVHIFIKKMYVQRLELL